MVEKGGYWRNLPLGSKLAALASLLIVAVVVALTVVGIQRERTTFRRELEDQAYLLLSTLPLTMRDQLYRTELDELLDVARVVGGNESVTLLRIYNNEGAILVDAAEHDPVFGQVVDPLGLTLVTLSENQTHIDWQPGQLVTGRAIWLGNQRIGAVAIGLSTTPLNEKLQTLTLQSTLIALATLVIGFGLSILFARQITSPLKALTVVATKMAEGNLETRVKPDTGDEIGQLGGAFNKMADSIHKRETDLRELTESLEGQVKERTAELRTRNDELVTINEELIAARQQAEEATQLKSQFLASMSHELRTPLNVIMGFSQILLAGIAGPMNDVQTERIERILWNAEALLDMINDLLDLSKIESGRLELIKKPFSVKDWLDSIVHQLEGLAHKKDVAFASTLDDDLPPVIVGDPVRLRQIVTNLISNAIKFTDEGDVKVAVKKESDVRWTIIVSDTGIGIPDDAQEYIFEEFRQVDGSLHRKGGGTGLGLSIVKNLVKLMGGVIRVDSATGKGSTFTVQLPLAVEEPD